MRLRLKYAILFFLIYLLTITTSNADENKEIFLQTGHSGSVLSVCFSPNGKLIASGSSDNTIKLWNVKDGALIRTFKGHSDYVISVNFSPDGRRIASGSSDNTIKLWNVKDGALIRTFKGHSSYVISVNFSPDGRRIASGSYDNTIKLWNVDNENDYYTFAALPDNEWISLKSDQLNYNSSHNGDKYAAIRYNNNTFNYKSLSKYRYKYKKVKGLFQSFAPAILADNSFPDNIDTVKHNIINKNKINNKNLNLKLQCKHEGKIKDAYDIDEDINVYAKCSNNNIKIKYNDDLKMFTGTPKCSSGTIDIEAYKFEKQSLSFNQNNKEFQVQMNFIKPVLYVLINPSKQLHFDVLKQSETNFELLKDQLRKISNILDGNDTSGNYRIFDNMFQRAYFFTQNAGHERVRLCNQGIIATKWNDDTFVKEYNTKIILKNQSIAYDQLIDDANYFFNGFSISDALKLKYASLFIIGAPDSKISKKELNKLEQKLRNNKSCSLIVQFGKKEYNCTPDKTLFKNLKVIQLNLHKEFYNKEGVFFEEAFNKIVKDFISLIDNFQ